jgi:ABC-type nickel/cobalt efflux system permease component RcnA
MLAAVVLLSQHSAMAALAGGWLNEISAAVVVLLGVLLLRAVRHI